MRSVRWCRGHQIRPPWRRSAIRRPTPPRARPTYPARRAARCHVRHGERIAMVGKMKAQASAVSTRSTRTFGRPARGGCRRAGPSMVDPPCMPCAAPGAGPAHDQQPRRSRPQSSPRSTGYAVAMPNAPMTRQRWRGRPCASRGTSPSQRHDLADLLGRDQLRQERLVRRHVVPDANPPRREHRRRR